MTSASAVQTAISGSWSFADPAIEYESRTVALVCIGFADDDPQTDDETHWLRQRCQSGGGIVIDATWQDHLIVFESMTEALAFTKPIQERFGRRLRIGVNLSESIAASNGEPGTGALFARKLMSQSEFGGMRLSAVVADQMTSVLNATDVETEERPSRWHIVVGALQLSVLLGYFLTWWYGIYWKTSIIAFSGSYTCWPEWLCR